MRSDHEREELQHCDVATEPQMGPKPKDAAAADEKNQATASYRHAKKKP
jgi:hypothetical protein